MRALVLTVEIVVLKFFIILGYLGLVILDRCLKSATMASHAHLDLLKQLQAPYLFRRFLHRSGSGVIKRSLTHSSSPMLSSPWSSDDSVLESSSSYSQLSFRPHTMSSTKSLIGNPQFAAPMTAKAAKEVFARKENSHPPSSMTLDPLWTERECRNALREMEVQRRKTVLHSTLSPASQLTHGPTGFDYLPLSLNERRSCSNNNNKGDVAPQPLQIDVILAPQLINVPTKKATKNLRRNNSNSKQRLNIRKTNEAMTPLALLSPGSCSVALTEPNTPSPKQGETRIGFAPGQQQRQHLPHVC